MSENQSKEKQEISKEHEIEIEEKEEVKKYVAEVIQSEFSGPIPPPSVIRGYEDILPGAADRIISMAERQSEHRQSVEKKMIEAEARDSLLGIISALVIGICCLIASVVVVVAAPAGSGGLAGTALGVTGIGSITATFIKSTRGSFSKKTEEKKEK